MKINTKKSKIGFFKRVKIAIVNMENYGMFLGERPSIAFKYFFLLLLIFAIILSFAHTYNFSKMIEKAKHYIQNELEDFEYSDDNVVFNNIIEAYDEEYKFKLYINTNEDVENDVIDSYEQKVFADEQALIILRDRFIYINYSNITENSYKSLTNMNKAIKDIASNISNKTDLLNEITGIRIFIASIGYFLASIFSMYMAVMFVSLTDLIFVTLLAWITARLVKVRLNYILAFVLAIYSLTLPIILNCIHNTANVLTGFYLEHFNLVYTLIAYIYVVAALFMIKYDIIEQTAELEKIFQIQKQLKKDNEIDEDDSEHDESEKDKKTEDNEDNEEQEETPINTNREPDGSEI